MGRGSYHHGNLRQALIDATVTLIEQKGPMAFTLTEAARLADVSAAAPYRHFASRDELLDEVARQGFVEFAERLETVYDDGKPSALSAFLRIGQAYLRFAMDRQGYYMVMFESGRTFPPNSPAGRASMQAYDILVKSAAGLFLHLPEGNRPPATMVANHMWSLSHGIVELFCRGTAADKSPVSPNEMLESAGLVYLRGLGVIPF